MISRLTTKTNGEWDWSSLEGEAYPAIVCRACGRLVKETYSSVHDRYGYCSECFTEDKGTALKAWIGDKK